MRNIFNTLIALLCGCALSTQAASVYGEEKTVHEFTLSSLMEAGRKQYITLETNAPQFSEPALKLKSNQSEEILQLRSEDWGKAQCLAFDIYYEGDHSGIFSLRAYAKGESKESINAVIGIMPQLKTRVTFPLNLLRAQEVFMKRNPARLKGVVQGRRLPLEELERMTLTIQHTGRETSETFYIGNVALLSSEPTFDLPDVKLVDSMGQRTQKDWPGKTPSIETLKKQLQDELDKAKKYQPNTQLSQYGGTLKKRFDASGYFRVEHDGTRWWMIDPEGCGFFSLGMDCVAAGESATILPGMEKLFEWLPEPDGDFRVAQGGDWQGSKTANFPVANLIRAFGPQDWKDNWRTITKARLSQWGFNTIGNWSDISAFRGQKIPYVLPLGNFPRTKTMLFRDFPDVFSPEYLGNSIRFAKELEAYKEDPWLIGYFMRNEPEWGFGSFNLASEMLEANPGTATRTALSAKMKEAYGEINALNKAWGTDLKSFDELISQNFRRMEEKSAQAKKDLWSFSEEMVSAYVKIPAEQLRKVDPHHLNLGMRYAWIASDLMYKAGEVFDVFTINSYEFVPHLNSVDEVARRCNKPTMIGEFHFGALDRGLPSTGLRAVETQRDRGLAYRRYVERGAANPNLLGTHYFILNDQAYLGRFDGENYQIGFVDTTHTPYHEMIEEVIKAHENVYDIMMGKKAPYDTPVKELRPISF